MAIIRPFSDRDKKNLEGAVTESLGSSIGSVGRSVSSVMLCGRINNPKSMMYDSDAYNMSPYIDLAMPVLNPFLVGAEGNNIKTILNKSNIMAIAQGSVIFDKSKGIEIDAKSLSADAVYTNDILLGGDYIRYLIDNLDVEEEIGSILVGIVAKGLKRSGIRISDNMDVYNYGDFDDDNGVLIIDKYCYKPREDIDAEKLAMNISKIVSEKVNKYYSRLTLLLCLRESKQVLYDMLLQVLPVLPVGYRPKFMNKEDKLTVAYDNVFRRSSELSRLLSYHSLSLSTVRIAYQDLVRGVKNIMTEGENQYDKTYKPLMMVLKGKKGLIRDKMQGARVDYSGRSVIISDPNMSLDSIGVPINMLEKLLEVDIVKEYHQRGGNKAESLGYSKREVRRAIVRRIAKSKVIITGRQPTLYNLSLRAFKIVPTDGDAIVMNPLSTTAFNADFDGDQMHLEAIITDAAKIEAEKLMGAVHNVFLPRNGECHIAPRQEIIHGLWKASSVKAEDFPQSKHVSVTNYNVLLGQVLEGTIKIYDTVTLNGITETAGMAAIRACLTSRMRNVRLGVIPITTDPNVPEKPVKEKFFKEFNKYIVLNYKEDFVDTVNKTVKLGFAVTEMFTPTISVVNYPDTTHLKEEFEEEIKEREELYNMGLETDEAFATYYSTKFRELEEKMTKEIVAGLGSTNGFVEMKESGPRGNNSNFLQIFGMKGRVKKNESEAFNTIMRHSHVEQLDALEHGITAYGGREGLIDKSIETYGPGYFSRKLSHVTSPLSIVTEDCGDTEGLLLDYDFLKQFVSDSLTGEDAIDNSYVKSLMISILVGKYIVGEEYMIGSEKEASVMYDKYIASVEGGKFDAKPGIRLRSPITCKCPCCAKCYGLSPATNAMAIVGEPVGALASGSIGEPGTQLIMKNFQSGGVAGVKNLTSSFSLTEEYTGLQHKRKVGQPIGYDYISPVTGDIVTVSLGNGTKLVRIMGENAQGKIVNKLANRKVVVYEDTQLKEHVEVGETIQKHIGYKDMHEILDFLGADYAKKYLALVLFNIYRKEAFVSFKHFEVLVSQMSFKICIRGNDYFKPGIYYTMQEFYSHDSTDCVFIDTIRGIKKVPLLRNDVFSTVFMEDIQQGIARSIITSGKDDLKLPIIRYSFGLPLQFGSAVPGYVERRSNY